MGLLDKLFGKKNTDNNVSKVQQGYTNKGHINATGVNITNSNRYDIQNNFIAIDLETTGLSSETDKIIEVGAVKFVNGSVTERYGSLIKIGFHIPDAATRVNKITDGMLASQGKDATTVYRELAEFLKDALSGKTFIVAHNASFDMGFLSKALSEYGYSGTLNYLDTLKISRATIKGLDNYKQPTVAKHFGIVNNVEHRAVSDAETCGLILSNLLEIKQAEKEADIKTQTEKVNKNTLNDEENEIGAVILDILKRYGADVSKFRFYKNSGNYIDMSYVYTLWKYKVAKKGSYIILPINKVKNISLETETCTKSEGDTTSIRVYFNNPFELENVADILMEVYNEFIANGSEYNSFNKYEKEFFASVNWSEITDISGYIEKAKQRIQKNVAEQELINAQEEEKRQQQIEKEQAKLKKKEEAELRKIANAEAEVERERIRKELLENADTYTVDMIKSIVELSQSENKRAVIKLDDDGEIYKVYESLSDACNDVGLAPKTIRDVCNGKGKHAGGFVWKYADEYLKI